MNTSSTTLEHKIHTAPCATCACPPWCTIDHENVWIEPGDHTANVAEVPDTQHSVMLIQEPDEHHRISHHVTLWLAGNGVEGMTDITLDEAPDQFRALARMLIEAADALEKLGAEAR